MNLRDNGFGEPAIGTVLYFAYLPLGIYTNYVLTENLTAFLILLFLHLYTRSERSQRRKRYAFAIGLSLSLLMLTRPMFQYFSLISVLFVSWRYYRMAGSAQKGAITLLFLGFFAVYGSWLAVLNSGSPDGKFNWKVTGERTIDQSLNESYDLLNDGYPTLSRAAKVVKPFESISEAPLESIGLRFEKFVRLIKLPATVYHNPYLIPDIVLTTLHAILISWVLVAIFFFLKIPSNFLFAFPLIYSVTIYTAYFSEERRFLLPVIPVAILVATFGARLIKDNYSFSYKQKVIHLLAAAIFFATGLTLLYGFSGISIDGIEPKHLFLVLHLSGSLFLLAASYLGYLLFDPERNVPRLKVFILFSLLTIAFPFMIDAHRYHPWARWKTIIDKSTHVRQEIKLPDELVLDEVSYASVQIDAQLESRFEKTLQVTINGKSFSPVRLIQSPLRDLLKLVFRPFVGKSPDGVGLPPPRLDTDSCFEGYVAKQKHSG